MSAPDVTSLLISAKNGNRESLNELFPLVYDELRRLASSKLRSERTNHTLQPTALVHEAYLRLIDQRETDWRNRAHFFGLAAEMMRRILVNYAIASKSEKRGGGATKIQLDEALGFAREREIDFVELNEALDKLAELDEKQAKIVELRFFGGLSLEETAETMEISVSTVQREWRMAKAWLYHRMSGS